MTAPLEHWRDEMRSALLYRVLAETEKGTSREALFADLARAAEAQGAIWAEAVRGGGEALPSLAPGLRVRIVALFVRLLRAASHPPGAGRHKGARPVGLRRAIPAVTRCRPRSRSRRAPPRSRKRRQSARGGVRRERRARLEREPDHGRRGRTSGRVSILLTGVGGLLAGAFSMAAGEYVSVRSQRELFETRSAQEQEELERYPEEEAEELALIYAARGEPRRSARDWPRASSPNPKTRARHARARRARPQPRRSRFAMGRPLRSFVSFASARRCRCCRSCSAAAAGRCRSDCSRRSPSSRWVGRSVVLGSRRVLGGGLRMLADRRGRRRGDVRDRATARGETQLSTGNAGRWSSTPR